MRNGREKRRQRLVSLMMTEWIAALITLFLISKTLDFVEPSISRPATGE